MKRAKRDLALFGVESLSSAAEAHLRFGIGGATTRTLRGLEWRGLVVEDAEKSNAEWVVWKLTEKGERMREYLRQLRGDA